MALHSIKMNNKIIDVSLKRLLISHAFLLAGRNFFEIFMSIYIWKETSSLEIVAFFNIIYLVTHTIIFTIFANYVKKGHVNGPRKLGLLGYSLVYFVIFLLGEHSLKYIYEIAFAIGVCSALYWVSFNVLFYDLSHSKNRGNVKGVENSIRIAIGIIIPVLGGYLIALNIFDLGYASIFFLGAILFLVSFFLANFKIPIHTTSKTHLRKTFSLILKDKEIMKLYATFVLGGIGRMGAISVVILPILLFDILLDEFTLGGWISFFAFIALITSLVFGKFVDYKHYKKTIVVGGLLSIILLGMLIYFPSLVTYLLYGTLSQIFIIFVIIPKSVMSMNIIETLPDHKNHRIEYLVIREWFGIVFGRASSYIILLIAGSFAVSNLVPVLTIMILAIVIEILILISIKIDF